MGCEKGIHGVGMLVADRWIEKVLDVKRVSERLMVVRVIVGRELFSRRKMMRGRGFARAWRERMTRAICLEWPSNW